MQSLEGFTSVGIEPALCVNVNNDFGVVCLGHKSTFCSTCKHHSFKCKHIQQLLDAIENIPIEELPPQLKVFTNCEIPSIQQTHKYAKLVSEKKISFSLSQYEAVFKGRLLK